MQQNIKCRLCGERDEIVNHILSECSKLTPKEYKILLDCLGKMIHWESSKKLNFEYTTKWYMYTPE